MNATAIYLGIALIGLVLTSASYWLWRKYYGNQFITVELIAKRKVYKNVSVFGLILFLSGFLYSCEISGLAENTSLLGLIIPCMAVVQSRVVFEPYYTTDIVDHIDELCVYLRPFKMDTKNRKTAHGFLWIPEHIEKLLCGRIEKKVAPVFCIGDPNSPIPTTLRATGIYATDTEWKFAVEKLANKSRLIILLIMETEGCIWELQHCINSYLDKTLFVVSNEQNLMLLKRFLSQSNVKLPNIVFDNDGISALYFSKDKSQWHVAPLRSSFDINKLVVHLTENIDSVKRGVSENKKSGNLLAKPFKENTVGSMWAHVVALLFEPLWYVFFNRWPKLWVGCLFGYSVLVLLIPSFITEDVYMYIALYLLLLTPWLWLGPRITSSCNRWGSREVARRANMVLMKWAIVFNMINILLGLMEV